MLIRIDQTELLSQSGLAERFPAPARQVVRKLVQLEVIVERAAHHVMFEDGVRRGPHRVEQFTKVRDRPSERAAQKIAVEQRERLGRVHRGACLRLSAIKIRARANVWACGQDQLELTS